MNRCDLCGKPIIDNKYCYGLSCLKKVCSFVEIRKVKNLKKENTLNNKIEKITKKENLNKSQKRLLTNRYLTYKMLKEVDIEYYKNITKQVEKDIKIINNNTKETDISSNCIITLKEAFEIYKFYKRYVKFKEELDIIMSKKSFDELQNLSWDIVNFAFNSYYNRKPYLSTLTQYIQLVVWFVGIKILRYNRLCMYS